MPLKSESQKRLFYGVASGSIKKPGLTRGKAQEFIDETPKGAKLPEKKKARPTRKMK